LRERGLADPCFPGLQHVEFSFGTHRRFYEITRCKTPIPAHYRPVARSESFSVKIGALTPISRARVEKSEELIPQPAFPQETSERGDQNF
jgi:hypothetical protein